MRWLVGFVLLLLALGTLRTVGCGDESPCGNCDDGNPCTRDWCRSYDPDAPMHCSVVHECENTPVDDGTPCGSGKVCVRGVCGENRCEGVVCEDEDPCTDDTCDYVDGTCDFEPVRCDDENECTTDACDPIQGCIYTPVEGLRYCSDVLPPEICERGTCVAIGRDACTNTEDLAIVCDPGFGNEIGQCVHATPGFGWEPREEIALCLTEKAGVSADCAICYAGMGGCMFLTGCDGVCGDNDWPTEWTGAEPCDLHRQDPPPRPGLWMRGLFEVGRLQLRRRPRQCMRRGRV